MGLLDAVTIAPLKSPCRRIKAIATAVLHAIRGQCARCLDQFPSGLSRDSEPHGSLLEGHSFDARAPAYRQRERRRQRVQWQADDDNRYDKQQ